MEHEKAMCGGDCGDCTWREQFNCPGCTECKANMFWGECDKAKCCLEKGLAHCGECENLPCEKLSALFADPEHGDRGARLRNLRAWAAGEDCFEPLR